VDRTIQIVAGHYGTKPNVGTRTPAQCGCGNTRPGRVVYHYFRARDEYNKLTKSLILPLNQVSPKVCPLPTCLLRIHEIAIFAETLDRARTYDGYGHGGRRCEGTVWWMAMGRTVGVGA